MLEYSMYRLRAQEQLYSHSQSNLDFLAYQNDDIGSL